MSSTLVSDPPAGCEICGADAPVEEEEVVCCAQHQTQWHCGSCDAHLVGFAFPLGRCPRCSGELNPLEVVTGPDAEVIEAVRHAVAIELGGGAFYSQAAEQTTDPDVRALCLELAGHEKHHLEQLQLSHHLPPEAVSPENAVGLATVVVYGGTKAPPTGARELLELAVELELRARDFFVEQRDSMAVGSHAREIYSHLAAEEAEHVAQVKKLLATK